MLPLALAFGFVFFGSIVNRHYPIKDWIFLRYAKSWALAAFWSAGCLSAGYAIIRRLTPRLPLRERLVLSLSTGVYAFFLLMFVGGILGLYRFGAFAWLLAALMLASGARPFAVLSRRVWRHARAARRMSPPRVSPLRAAITAFGTLYLGLVYLSILHPDNASFDSIYYHLGIAQQYAAQGGIYPTPEGWIVDGLPLLGSTLYAWAFIVPTNDLFDAMMACAHMEFVVFAATLASLPVLVRWMLPRANTSGAWVAMFLFPAILVYDAGLHSANDHIAAFWGVPIWLAMRRCWERLDAGYMALFAVSAAGALMTKYQAAGLVLMPVLALLGRAALLALRKADARWGRGLGVALGVGVAITSPLWLKNWVWYGDPLFPALHKYVSVRPYHPHASEMMDHVSSTMLRPHGTFRQQLRQIIYGAFEFPFRTHERPDFHKDWPVFGPLFHLSLLWLPFLRNTKRVWLLFGATLSGLFFWYFFNHFERYLQPMIPWMAAVAAAALVLVWQRGWIAKLGAVAVVGLEIVWGADVIFFPHIMLGDAPIRASVQLINSGFRGDLASRDRIQGALKQIGDALPEGAKVLLHEHNPRLGLNAPIVMDMPMFQTGISYQDLGSAREVYDLYRKLGVTHIVYQNAFAWGFDNLAGDLRFWEFVTNWTVNPKRVAHFVVAEMPPTAPDREPQNQVVYLGCKAYGRGLHPLSQMNLGWGRPGPMEAAVPAPKDRKKLPDLVSQADFIVTDPDCNKPRLHKSLFQGFVRAAKRETEELWVRRLVLEEEPAGEK